VVRSSQSDCGLTVLSPRAHFGVNRPIRYNGAFERLPFQLRSQPRGSVGVGSAGGHFAGRLQAAVWIGSTIYAKPRSRWRRHFPLTQQSKRRRIRTAAPSQHMSYLGDLDTGVFKVTVVDIPCKQMGSDAAAITETTRAVVGGGTIKFYLPHRVDAVYGRPARHRRSERRLLLRGAVLHDNRLYRVEGKAFVAGGQAWAEPKVAERPILLC
jgi:hypothetical protein